MILSVLGLDQSHLVASSDGLMHQAVVADWQKLQQAALKAGFFLKIASGFRDFHRQQMIWDGKFQGLRPVYDDNEQAVDLSALSDLEKIHAIMRFSALPGSSRHHFGSDFDVYAENLIPKGVQLGLQPSEYERGHQAPLSRWLDAHLHDFGFYRPYSLDLGGVAREPWHISHIATSQDFLSNYDKEKHVDALLSHHVAGASVIVNQLDALNKRYMFNLAKAPQKA